ncbi:MAG: tRNA 4-thiouridine(8) synthase ThiI [Oscillospiraceae bacterium]|nr:tRNA 4-thiouridine(8) synthase ThiI [Oscillospiraceae bacterium]
MNEMLLIKLGEIVLKGLNRKTFEAVLLKTIRYRLAGAGAFDVRIAQSTIYILPKDESADLDEAAERIGRIFGIVAYSRAAMTEKTLESVQQAAAAYLEEELESARTFKVETKRSDKKFPLGSPEISMEVGGYLLEKFPHLTVDVHNPDVVVHVEIRDFAAFVHGTPLPGAGGIPVGTGGKGAILISGGLDSPVAAWMMAKRGVELVAVHFASPPYTSPRAEDKVHRLLELVSRYSGRMKLYTVHFTEIQEQIRDRCPEELFTILMRRFMMRIAEGIAKKEGCGALITGESLGQVASQTMQAIGCTDAVTSMPVFRPLIGMDKTEIVSIARKIGTFETSIEPYEDCCTVFTPKHPRTRPDRKFVEFAEEAMDVEGLVERCVAETRYCKIGYHEEG